MISVPLRVLGSEENQLTKFSHLINAYKNRCTVKPGFKSVPPQFYFEIARLASAVKWREIQNIDEEECF